MDFKELLSHLATQMVADVSTNVQARTAGVRTGMQPWQVQRAYEGAHASVIQMANDSAYKAGAANGNKPIVTVTDRISNLEDSIAALADSVMKLSTKP